MAERVVRVEGVPQVVADLQRLTGDLDDLSTGLDALAAQAAAQAALGAPRRTGALARTITSRTGGNRAVVTAGTTRINYGRFPEYGTRRMPADHFMRPADRTLRDGAEQQITQNIRTAIQERGLA